MVPMVIAFLFPGQGARDVLSSLSFARATPYGEGLVARAVRVAGTSLEAITAQAGRALERTEILQPVLTAIALSVHARLRSVGLAPSLVLGHSLGELAAWTASGVLSDEEAIDLAATRGALMAREAERAPGGLLALPSLEQAHRALAFVLGLEIAAINSPDEVVVSGPFDALRAVSAAMPARRVPVSGPWHGRAMSCAVAPFRAALSALPHRPRGIPLVQNVDGALAPGDSPLGLADQLTRPVQFIAALATARAHGVDTFVTVGPGHVLRGLVRRNLGRAVQVLTTEDEADLARTVKTLEQRP